jgi:hypothetical protein
MHKNFCLVIFLCLVISSGKVFSVEALSTQELLSHCKAYKESPDGIDATFCVRYVQGFIDGAVITDGRVTMNIADEIDRTESYTERVMRTRLGSRISRYGPSVYAEFCLGEPIELRAVVDKVIENLLKPDYIKNRLLARQTVYQTLRDNYPCEADK